MDDDHTTRIVHSPLSIVHCPPSIVRRPSPIVHRPSPIARHPSSSIAVRPLRAGGETLAAAGGEGALAPPVLDALYKAGGGLITITIIVIVIVVATVIVVVLVTIIAIVTVIVVVFGQFGSNKLPKAMLAQGYVGSIGTNNC